MELVGSSDSGTGVTGTSKSGTGVKGTSDTHSGVVGNGGNIGLEGTGGSYGVTGIGDLYGVYGNGNNDAGVSGESANAYGGAFNGGLAPLWLVPSHSQGPPNTGDHLMGEFYVDNQGALYFCVANGTPGTWKRVQLV